MIQLIYIKIKTLLSSYININNKCIKNTFLFICKSNIKLIFYYVVDEFNQLYQ